MKHNHLEQNMTRVQDVINGPNVTKSNEVDTEKDESDEELMAGMMAIISEQHENNRTVLDRLVELHDSDQDNNKKMFSALLDKVAFDILEKSGSYPDFNENIKKLKNRGNLKTEEESAIRNNQREMNRDVRSRIMELAGIPTEAGMTTIELGKKIVKEKLETSKNEINKPEDVLFALGILRVETNDDQPKFVYPANLFPRATDDKWGHYLDSVKRHLKTVGDFQSGLTEKISVETADTARRVAHDIITRDVHAILGFENLPSDKWDFSKTRNLVAKMRDERYPTVATSEKAVVSIAATEGLGVYALKIMSQKLADLDDTQNQK